MVASTPKKVKPYAMHSKSFSDLARHAYRSYRNGRVTVGHSLLRRALGAVVGTQQEVRLRSGLRMALDLSRGNQQGIFWDDGDSEVHLYWAIRELVPLGGTFLDCGANCGLMGLLARQYRRARVLFFEPHPRLAKSVDANIRLNGFSAECELVEAAVSDTTGEVPFFEHSLADGSHSIHRDWAEELNGEMRPVGKVRCVALRDVVVAKKLAGIDFLKIDTEGNDYAVLKGLAEYLEPSFTRVVYMEMSRDREAIRDLMQSRGYTGFVFAMKRRRETRRAQKRYEQGGQVLFFKPMLPGEAEEDVALWCGSQSALADYLRNLDASERE